MSKGKKCDFERIEGVEIIREMNENQTMRGKNKI